MPREITVIETAAERAANWREQAELCWRDGMADCWVMYCLTEAAIAEYEGDRVIRWFEEEP